MTEEMFEESLLFLAPFIYPEKGNPLWLPPAFLKGAFLKKRGNQNDNRIIRLRLP